MIKGFHANYKNECQKYINNQDYLIISNDNDYMGRGMYFWEHKSNAEYWRKEKKSDRDSAIVSAEINDKSMLDLTDDDICSYLQKILEKVKKLPVRFGRKLDYIFESFPEMNQYNVVKGREHKDKKKENDFLIQTNLTTKSIDIYCVKNICAILKKEWVA